MANFLQAAHLQAGHPPLLHPRDRQVRTAYRRGRRPSALRPERSCFDRTGGFWFTDFGHETGRIRHRSGIYYVTAGGQASEVSFGGTGYNGIGLSPDETTVYAAETFTGRLIAFDLEAPGKVVKGGRGGRLVGTAPNRAFLDSLAVQANGDVCVASIRDGITIVAPDGGIRREAVPDRLTTNICFGGSDLRDAFITLSQTGRLIRRGRARPPPELRPLRCTQGRPAGAAIRAAAVIRMSSSVASARHVAWARVGSAIMFSRKASSPPR